MEFLARLGKARSDEVDVASSSFPPPSSSLAPPSSSPSSSSSSSSTTTSSSYSSSSPSSLFPPPSSLLQLLDDGWFMGNVAWPARDYGDLSTIEEAQNENDDDDDDNDEDAEVAGNGSAKTQLVDGDGDAAGGGFCDSAATAATTPVQPTSSLSSLSSTSSAAGVTSAAAAAATGGGAQAPQARLWFGKGGWSLDPDGSAPRRGGGGGGGGGCEGGGGYEAAKSRQGCGDGRAGAAAAASAVGGGSFFCDSRGFAVASGAASTGGTAIDLPSPEHAGATVGPSGGREWADAFGGLLRRRAWSREASPDVEEELRGGGGGGAGAGPGGGGRYGGGRQRRRGRSGARTRRSKRSSSADTAREMAAAAAARHGGLLALLPGVGGQPSQPEQRLRQPQQDVLFWLQGEEGRQTVWRGSGDGAVEGLGGVPCSPGCACHSNGDDGGGGGGGSGDGGDGCGLRADRGLVPGARAAAFVEELERRSRNDIYGGSGSGGGGGGGSGRVEPKYLRTRSVSDYQSAEGRRQRSLWDTPPHASSSSASSGLASQRPCSLTDADLEELRGFFDLGFKFGQGGDISPEMAATLPALRLYRAVGSVQQRILQRHSTPPRHMERESEAAGEAGVARKAEGRDGCGKEHAEERCKAQQGLHTASSHAALSEMEGRPQEVPSGPASLPHPLPREWAIADLNDPPADVKTNLRLWAQAVATTVRQTC